MPAAIIINKNKDTIKLLLFGNEAVPSESTSVVSSSASFILSKISFVSVLPMLFVPGLFMILL